VTAADDDLDRKLLDHDDDDDPAEVSDAWMRRMIGAARASGFDEEPAPRVDALLMAAARRHAPRPRAPWWARLADWARPAFGHPALAGAAALVIVGGAAGVMYRRGHQDGTSWRVAGPSAPRSSAVDAPPPPALPAPPAPSGAAVGVPQEVLRPELPSQPATLHRPTTARTEKPTEARVGGSGSLGESQTFAKVPSDGPGGGGRDAKLDRGADSTDRDPPLEEAGGGDHDGTDERAPGQVAAESPPTAEVPRLPVDERAPEATIASDSVTSTRGGIPTGPSPRAQSEQLLAQARTASRANNCGAVKAMAIRVRKLDAAYYQAVFARDPAVKRCR